MKSVISTYRDLRDDEDGASFIEYTVLLGVLLAVSIAIIFNVGKWASNQWANLNTQLT